MVPEIKKQTSSKTVIFNVLVLVSTAASSVVGLEFVQDYASYIVAGVAVINWVLRVFFTKQPIG